MTTRSLEECADSAETGYDRDRDEDDSFKIICVNKKGNGGGESPKPEAGGEEDQPLVSSTTGRPPYNPPENSGNKMIASGGVFGATLLTLAAVIL